MLAHRTIAVSEKTREQIARLPFLVSRIRVVHNGIDTTELLPRENALRQIFENEMERFLEGDPIVIGTIAELHKNKGLSYAIEGIAQLKKQSMIPFRYVIIGEGEERELLHALVQQLDLSDTVILAGYRENASELLSAFDIFLLPSITEAFPYVILEAGNAGLPVIATAVGGIPEVIDDMESGILIHSKHPGEIARAAGFLLEDEKRRVKLGAAIKKRITGRFNITTMTEATLALYNEKVPENKDEKDPEDTRNEEAERGASSPHSSQQE
jgi:glycosyltransferase involved in cell wall biosynthesis